MKIKSGFIIREIAGQHMAIPIGNRVKELHGMIALNETGAFIWNLLTKEVTEQEITYALECEYQVSHDEAISSVKDFIDLLSKERLLEETSYVE